MTGCPFPVQPLLLPLQQYAPSVFEKYTTSVTVGKKEVTLNLYDTAGKGFFGGWGGIFGVVLSMSPAEVVCAWPGTGPHWGTGLG